MEQVPKIEVSEDLNIAIDRAMLKSALTLVDKWDFSQTRIKLGGASYCGWDLKRITEAELDYKRFLALAKAAPDLPIVPSRDLDRFWHEHILDTRRYAKDCYELFGDFFHHNPFFGMNGSEDEAEWIAAAEQSSTIWQIAFDNDLYRIQDIETTSHVVRHCRAHCIPSSEVVARRPHCRSHCIP